MLLVPTLPKDNKIGNVTLRPVRIHYCCKKAVTITYFETVSIVLKHQLSACMRLERTKTLIN